MRRTLLGSQREALEIVERGEGARLKKARVLRLRDRGLVTYEGAELVLSHAGRHALELARAEDTRDRA